MTEQSPRRFARPEQSPRRFARPGLLDHLRGFGEQAAVLTATTQLSYTDLADLTAEAAGTLGTVRQLVLLETRNDVATLVHYLGALAGGHVVLPVPADRDHTAMVQTYDPDVIVVGDRVEHRNPGGGHRLHDDLALLLSTSGSTGSPKLVRLSRTNLLANACSIAEYLDIRETDRAATTLPMSYCYGLSVIHSHLLRGAALILTDDSVVDASFWELFRRHGGTTFAGVPYTFELLDRIGFDRMDLPGLRYLTQAGGRMPPAQVSRFASLGENRGWQLFVMYGATEATARMAYLPAELAQSNLTSIGRPIPGGSFSIDPLGGWADDEVDNVGVADADVGELVYHGANVMMGYANGPSDLALEPGPAELRTGDIARRGADGLYEVIGRRSRFVKMFGLRIDLDRIESALTDDGIRALCTDDGDGLAVVAVGGHDERRVRRAAAAAAGVPADAVRAVAVAELPALPSGKPDYPAVRVLAGARDDAADGTDLTALFGEVLGIDPATIDPDASFVDLGGNSLSYVAMSVRLERALGRLPTDWQRVTLRDLQQMEKPGRRRRPWWSGTLETSVALRAAAIVLVVGSHAELWVLWGGAHVLLGVAGYNFGRFCLTPLSRPDRARHLRNTIAWVAVPSIAWVVIALVITDDYHWTNLLLANKFFGPEHSMTAGRLWFVEILVWILAALAAVCCLPAVDRFERRRPFELAMVFLALGVALRYGVFGFGLGHDAWFTVLAFWFFAVGWAAAKATSNWQRAVVTAVLAVGLHGYFADGHRETLVFVGLALLIWLPALRCPSPLALLAGLIAEASLYTYLTHFQVYALFPGNPAVGVVVSVIVGVAITQILTAARRRVRGMRRAPSRAAVPALR